MKRILLVVMASVLWCAAQSQLSGVYKISGADSVKIFKTGGFTELILQNKTKDTLGFLFNKGGGLTEFRRALKKVNDSVYLIGGDTLRISSAVSDKTNASNLSTNGIFASKSGDSLYFRGVASSNTNIGVSFSPTSIILNGKSFVDSVRKRSDTLFYYTGGSEFFGFKGLGNVYTASDGVQQTGNNFAIGGTLNNDIIIQGGQGAFGVTTDSLKFANINTKGATSTFQMFMNGQTGQAFFGKATDYGILVDNTKVLVKRNNGVTNTGSITIDDVQMTLNSTDTLKLQADVRTLFGSAANGRNIYLPAYATAGDSVLQVTSTGQLINVPRGSGGSGTPGGTDQQIQVNSVGAFAGYATFVRDVANATVKIGPLYGTGNTNPYLQFVDTSTSTTQKRYIQFDPRRTYTNSVPFSFAMTWSANADAVSWNNIMRMGWNPDNTAAKNGLYETWENDLQAGSARTTIKYTTYYNKTAAATVKPFEMNITEGATIAASLNSTIFRGNIFELKTMADESLIKATSDRATNHSLVLDMKNDQGKGVSYIIDPSITNNTLFIDPISTNNIISYRTWSSIAFGNTTPISAKELVIPSDESGSIKVGTDIVFRTRGGTTSTITGKGAGANFGANNTNNVLNGYLAMNNTGSTTTSFNTGIGSQTLRFAGAAYNTALGYNAGNDNVSGVDSFNVFVGANAGFGSNWTNVKNTFILNASVAADNTPLLWGTFNNKRLGINRSAAPTATLDVTGDVKASSTITGTKFISTATVRSASTTDSAMYWNPSNNELELRPIATMTLQNLGTGSDGLPVALQVNSTTIGFYRLKAGTNITLTAETNDIKIDAAGGGGGVTDGDKGDIDITGSGTVYTVDTASVSYIKMQQMSTNKILGRSSASTGIIEELGPGTGISISGGNVNNTGLVSLSSIGNTPNANGATKTGTVLNLEPASTAFGGVVTIADQAFSGRKTFDSVSINYTGGSADDGVTMYIKQNTFFAGVLVEQPNGSNDAYFSVKAGSGSGKRYDFVSKINGFFTITDNSAGNLDRFVIENTGNARIINHLSVNSNLAAASTLDVTASSLGTTATNTDGILIATASPAAVNAQQISPNLRWRANGWKTDATAASRSLDIRAYLKPVQGAANPSGYLTFESSINGASYTTDLLNLTTDGKVGILRAVPGFNLDVNGNAAFSDYIRAKDGGSSDVAIRFTSGSASTGIYYATTNTVGISGGGNPMTWDGVNAIFGSWTNGGSHVLSGPSAGAGNSNRAGTALIIRAGSTTGNGADGNINMQVSPSGTSGTSENAYVNTMTMKSSSVKLLETFAAVPSVTVPLLSVGNLSELPATSTRKYGFAVAQTVSNLGATEGWTGLFSGSNNTSSTTPAFMQAASLYSYSANSITALTGTTTGAVITNTSGSTTTTYAKGDESLIQSTGAGTKTITKAAGYVSTVSLLGGTATVTDIYNFKASNNALSGESSDYSNATVTNAYGFYYGNLANGTITNKYGYYSEDVGTGAGSFSYYSAGGKNYFAGNTKVNGAVTGVNSDNTPMLIVGGGANLPGTSTRRYGIAMSSEITNLGSGEIMDGLYVANHHSSANTPTAFSGANISVGTSKDITNLYAGLIGAVIDNSSGSATVTSIRGVQGLFATNSAGTKTVTRETNFLATTSLAGGTTTITDLFGVRVDNNTSNGGVGSLAAGAITNLYGVYVGHPTDGTITNEYSFYGEDVSASSTAYSFYSAGGKSQFNGKVGVNRLQGVSAAPSVTLGSSLTGSVSVVGTDLAGTVSVTISGVTSYATLAELFTLTYNAAYSSTPHVVWSPASSNAIINWTNGLYLKASGASSFAIATVGSGSSTTGTYIYTYNVIQ